MFLAPFFNFRMRVMKVKKILYLFLIAAYYGCFGQVSTNPSPLIAAQSGVLTFNKSSTPLSSYNGTIYAYIGVTVNGVQWQNIKGSNVWGDNSQPALTQATSNTYTLSIGPDLYSYFNVPTSSSITQICVVFRSSDATQQTADIFIPVGAFQYTLTAPAQNSNTFITSGSNFTITANNTNGPANYVLQANGANLNSATTANYSYTHTNITSNQVYKLSITQGNTTFSASFTVIVNPGNVNATLPTGLVDGVNYNANDPTKATLVLHAPFKDFVYVAGSFNNWAPTSAYAMRKDGNRYWLELTGLTPGQVYTFQYWVCDQTNRPANSPALVKTADPFSTLVLSPFDDPEIASLGVYPNLPAYPIGQEREVSVIQTGANAYWNDYQWSDATLNFVKPSKKDLVIYEVLVRDFDQSRTYQDFINKIDYFKSLNVNAIQLMPVMEFEGNMSWGYNTSFHLAPDKRYGPPSKLKEFIDVCHQNGIAVILDVALNHVFGRSPLVRMWMQDANNDGWGDTVSTTTENPYVNQVARHSYSVGSDLNHFREIGPGGNMTNTYVLRTIQHWINEYKIDGFRWDLTKGFTNNCTASDEGCTNNYQADRVGKLKWYADKQWEIDPDFYVIFEHLGTGGSANEETEWANYQRSGNTKGIMHWRKMTDPYANLVKGNSTNLSGVAESNDRMIGYAESHDEERVAYKALTEAGQTQNDLAKVLKRLPAMGALHLLVPGPKMIWHFGELGWDPSLWTCSNGNVSFSNPDCKLDTKPQPQWTNNWLGQDNRLEIYNSWARMNALRINEPVFENGQYAWNQSVQGQTRLDVWTSTTPTNSLSYVFVLTNFTNNQITVNGGFPYSGTWYNLMDNTAFVAGSSSTQVTIPSGEFRVYGNQQALLNVDSFEEIQALVASPNPTTNNFALNKAVANVQIYNIRGQQVKTFTNSYDAEYNFDISDLTPGVYIVKATDAFNRTSSVKLVKN